MKKIAYQDFKKASKMLGLASGPLQTAVDAANAWIEAEGVSVINIETLSDTDGIGGMTSTSQDGVRVWYTR